MGGLLTNNFLILLLFTAAAASSSLAYGEEEEEVDADFFRTCPSSTCGSRFDIRFPFRLHSANPKCSFPGFPPLTCSGTDAFLYLPSSPQLELRVASIDYESTQLAVRIGSGFGSLSSSCPLRNLSSTSDLIQSFWDANELDTLVFRKDISLVSCPEEYPNSSSIWGPISCLSGSGSGSFVYAVDASQSMYAIPAGCFVVQAGGAITADLNGDYDFGEIVENFLSSREVYANWKYNGELVGCGECESRGRHCGYDWNTNQTFCQKASRHGFLVKIITGTSAAGFVALGTVTLIVYYITRLSKREKEMRMKLEKFLSTYKNTKPIRYSYSGIRKITKRFKHKLGQGGFGIVYKGELLNGIPVAVKMLETSRSDEGQEFINEVATMGRIHHVNVVRLMGFCSEGTRRALVYEYMPNKSLEKFIFSKESRNKISTEKLLDIAVGIARGIEYLHQGCDLRILHFDIKPHNILLDHNFNPKISDFGLAKLCSRDQSMVTMTAVIRGTMGYIAPEIYSRNFGTVSYKSDVYSFGILLLEMVSGRRSADPDAATSNGGQGAHIYFPEWVYNRLVHGEDIGVLATDQKGIDADVDGVVKKLVIVALWCIQWSPSERPTMSRVVQILMGELESLQIPPKPFFSSSDQVAATSITITEAQ